MLGATMRAVYDVRRFLDPDVGDVGGEPVPEHPEDRLCILGDLVNHMESLLPRVPALTDGVAPQVRQYLHIADQIMRQHG
ncbi:hypothetical protein [Flindersiella endophytica]